MATELYNGDCLEIMPTLKGQNIDMVLADPPYGTTANKWDSVIPFDDMWAGIHATCKPETPILLFGQMPFGAALIMSNRKEYRYEWIWQKTNPTGFLNAKRMPMRTHENILVFYGKLPTYNPAMWKADIKGHRGGTGTKSSNYGDYVSLKNKPGDFSRYPIDVIRCSNADHTTLNHPTEKPVALLEYLIRTYTNPGDTVLDFCMGSGSTGVACIHTGRHFIGIELDQGYYKIAQERIAAAERGEQDSSRIKETA